MVSCGEGRPTPAPSLEAYHAGLAADNTQFIKEGWFGGSYDTFSDLGEELAKQGIVIHHFEIIKNDPSKIIDYKALGNKLSSNVHGPAIRIFTIPEDKTSWRIEWYLIPGEDALANIILQEYLHK